MPRVFKTSASRATSAVNPALSSASAVCVRAALTNSASCLFRTRPSIWLAQYPSRLSDDMISVHPATRQTSPAETLVHGAI
jgi:hypothetical protein